MNLKLKCIGLIGALLISSTALFGCGNNKTNLSGSGNTINESIAATDGTWVYYSTKKSIDDENYEYIMYKSKLDGTDKTEFLKSEINYYTDLNVSNDYIYYINYSYDTKTESIMRIKTDGTDNITIAESEDRFESFSNLNVSGDYIYYQKTSSFYEDDKDNSGTIMKSKIDGTENVELLKNEPDETMEYLNVSGDYLYYSSYRNDREDAAIIKMKNDGTDKTEIIKSDTANTSYNYINVVDDEIYYISTSYDDTGYSSKSAIMSVKNDGTKNTELLLNEEHEVFGKLNVYDGWIYYIDSDCQISKIKTDGSENTDLAGSKLEDTDSEGFGQDNFANLCIIDNTLYYKMLEADSIKLVPMKMKLDGTGSEEL